MNRLHTAFSGRIGGGPEQRYTRTCKGMLVFSVAVDENTTATEDRAAPETQWVRVTCWDQRAEELADVLKKGMSVYCEGRLRLSTWTAQDGSERHGLNVSAWTVQPRAGRRGLRRALEQSGETRRALSRCRPAHG